jgi:Swiss Army Knife protein, DSP-PTPase phosphatase domain
MDLVLPDGTRVRACGIAERVEDDPEGSFGLYLDSAWTPTWDAEVVDWPDFGLPAEPVRAAGQIVAAYERARAGELVEVGCRGGLGRTGTVLACMAVLAGLGPNEAVAWVRGSYDVRAVEMADQERWVEWFAAQGRRVASDP